MASSEKTGTSPADACRLSLLEDRGCQPPCHWGVGWLVVAIAMILRPDLGCIPGPAFGTDHGAVDADSVDSCLPQCMGRACGDDGCGGVCGVCSEGLVCVSGDCVGKSDCDKVLDCMAACTDGNCLNQCVFATRKSGIDMLFLIDLLQCLTQGCASGDLLCLLEHIKTVKTGACQDLYEKCVAGCQPSCSGRVCGGDGCGGSCGTCDGGSGCLEGICRPLTCGDGTCDEGESACTCPVDCEPYCGDGCCSAGEGYCPEECACTPSCASLGCGDDDGCGGKCTWCPEDDGSCVHLVCNLDIGQCIGELIEGPCEDGSPCTQDDYCFEGTCTGIPIGCDDGNPCTTDVCGPEYGGCVAYWNEEPCSDGNPCTVGDKCTEGGCLGWPKICDDGNPCTDDGCDPSAGECAHVSNSNPCDDGDPCTIGDSCAGGWCQSVPVYCDDGNPCTDDGCEPYLGGGCVHYPNFGGCDDGNLCTTWDSCQEALCVGFEPLSCDDANPCTDDSCDPAEGCVNVPNTAPCDSGNVCTFDDHCKDGECVGGETVSCEDGDPCTLDSCIPWDGCWSGTGPDGVPCDDGNPCTLNDTCLSGACAAGKLKTCPDDSNPCTDPACDPASGACTFKPNSKPCDDNNKCTVEDSCSGGACFGKPKDCGDGNPCTDDKCLEGTGVCSHTENKQSCDDGNMCTQGDTCSQGKCVPGKPVDCEDGNPCTAGSCDKAKGCSQVKLFWGACEDGDPCTVGESCWNGVCENGKPKNCLDGNPCTDDYCDPSTGTCMHISNEGACDDGDPCTANDGCDYGKCTGIPVDCNDGKACTKDSCDKATGKCLHEPIPGCV